MIYVSISSFVDGDEDGAVVDHAEGVNGIVYSYTVDEQP